MLNDQISCSFNSAELVLSHLTLLHTRSCKKYNIDFVQKPTPPIVAAVAMASKTNNEMINVSKLPIILHGE